MSELIPYPQWYSINGEEFVSTIYFTEEQFMEKFKAYQMAGHDDVFYHYAMGLLSNYNICCIDFFCTYWDDEFFDDLKSHYEFTLIGAKHIKCPNCIIMELSKNA